MPLDDSASPAAVPPWRDHIHPAAGLFPMMGEAELQELGRDILANGLQQPLAWCGDQLLDGRNRLAAVETVAPPEDRAHLVRLMLSGGSDPDFMVSFPPPRVLPEGEAVAHIVSANILRRHMTAGQRAMALALIYPESGGAGGRGRRDPARENPEATSGFSDRYLRMARAVLRHSETLAREVLAGDGLSLDAAYQRANSKFPLVLAAVAAYEKGLWTIADAVLNECGPPDENGSWEKLEQLSQAFLSEGLDEYSAETLREYRDISYAFPPDSRQANPCFSSKLKPETRCLLGFEL